MERIILKTGIENEGGVVSLSPSISTLVPIARRKKKHSTIDW